MIVFWMLMCTFAGLSYVFYRIRKDKMKVFKELGIPGPEPNFLFGNLLDFRNTPLYVKHQEWRAQYGETFGYFEGPTPVLVTSDVSLLQEVFVKQFNKFHARKLWPVQVDPDKDEDVHMFFARGRRWKRLRHVVNPAFSTAKIRKMAPTVNECINHLLDVLRDNSNAAAGKTIEIMNLFRRLTLDTILRCEVGLDQNSVKQPDDLFLKHCKGVIDDTAKTPWLYTLGFMFPDLHCVWITIYKLLHKIKFNPVFWLEDKMREVIVMRRNMKDQGRNDLMQQMLDAQYSVNSFQELENEEQKLTSPYKTTLKSMTNGEIVSHALLFLLAGYETTSTTLAYIFFELSQNPHVQQRLRQEVKAVLPRGYNSILYEDLKKLTYMDFVIWETLRKYPLASTVTARQCMQECTIGDLNIPKGLLVHANLWDVQYDPKHWGNDPQKFDPLRFMPEKRRTRHPNAWMPFGGGPRSCAGLSFALLQLKMVVAKVVRDFDFHPSEKQSSPLKLMQGATILPTEGVHLATMRRGSAMSEAGLRRGSVMAGVSLNEWKNMRGTSACEEDTDDECLSGLLEINNSWKVRRESITDGFLPGYENRRNSSAVELPVEDQIEFRRASITQGIELLAEESLRKGFNMLRKVSFNEESGVEKSSADLEDSGTLYTTLLAHEELNASIEVSTKAQDIVGVKPHLRSRRVLRRSSALPDLQSVQETVTVDRFMSRKHAFIAGSTAELTTDDEILRKAIMSNGNRLYERRGSG